MTRKHQDFSQDGKKVEQEAVEEVKEAEQGEDIESFKKALAEEKERAEKYLANWQRAQADLSNIIKRFEKERAEYTNFANSSLILSLLPVLDDLERAMGNVTEELEGSKWVEGVRLIYRKFKSVLESQGLAAIEAEGKDFDPNYHEAVMVVEGEEGKVIEEVRRGYKFRERVIRPTQVKVGRGIQE